MSKTLEFIYQDTSIHFLMDNSNDVMVNATEMAKPFGKRVRDFERLDGTENYIQELLLDLNNSADVRCYNREDVYNTNRKGGTYMHRYLAIKFAYWLDVKFEVWITKTIDELIFGNYKKHWDAHAKQEEGKAEMAKFKQQMLLKPTEENVLAYFEAVQKVEDATRTKSKVIKEQIKLFNTIKE